MSTRTWSADSYRKPIVTTSYSTPPPPLQQQLQQLHIGDRVQVNSLHGIIRFIGTTKFKAGTWAGIELDNIGLGKNDGSVEGKRYFICPPNTGLFILAIKVIKQQHHLLIHNRPSTPHHISTKSSPLRVLPPLPKKEDNESQLLKKKIDALESENRILKQENKRIQSTVNDVKKAGMDSIEILEDMVQSHHNTIQHLESLLSTERKKNNELQHEQNELRKAGLEAIESYETTLKSTNLERRKLVEEKDIMIRTHHHEIKLLLEDIHVLETVLQDKMDKEIDLTDSLKRERQNNSKITTELKGLKFQMKINAASENRWSFMRERLDTPIEEVDEEEEEEEDLFDDNILSQCVLCEKKGHDLIHCSIITNQQQQQRQEHLAVFI